MVEYISESDIYEVRLVSLLTNVDKDVIVELYQPIIGATPAMLYLNLLKQKRNEEEETVFSMEKLISTMQLSLGQILNARHTLEAVGLLSTYEKQNENNRSYIFVLYAPKTPKDFFDDILFKGLLVQAVGKREAQRLAKKYVINLSIPKEYKDVSASFIDVFSPNYDDKSFQETFDEPLVGRKTRKIKVSFSPDVFFKAVEENSQIRKEVFVREDIKQLESLAMLYGVDEITLALAVIDVYDGYTVPHINYEEVAKQVREREKFPGFKKEVKAKVKEENTVKDADSIMLKKANLMETTSPAKYLRLCLNNTKPSEYDLDVIDKITMKYDLPNGVVNALIDYTLYRCDGKLNFRYMDKVASTLASRGYKTCLDAMNYLSKARYKVQKEVDTPVNEVKEAKEEVKISQPKPVTNDEPSDEEIDALFKKINSTKGKK